MTSGDVLQVTTSIKGRRLDTLRFREPEISIGRDPACAVVFDNPGVSRLHAVVTLQGDGTLRIVDRQSSNGTYVNGQRVTSSALRPGDKIDIGKFSLEVAPIVAGTTATAGPAASTGGEPEFLAARPPTSQAPDGGTVVLGAGQRERILGEAQAATNRTAAPRASRGSGALGITIGFLAGAFLGALVTYLLVA